jgi:hypothetical protein
MTSLQPSILLQLYYSVMENIRFHEHQLARLEQRSYAIQQEILNTISRNNREQPYILRPQPRTTPRRRPSENNSYTNRRRNTSPNFEVPSRGLSETPDTEPTSPIIPSWSPIPEDSSTELPPSGLSDNYSFNYIRTVDFPIGQPLYTSFARSLLNRASASSSSSTASSPLHQTTLSDPGSLLLYFMLENIQNETVREEQHGITDPRIYITDMLYRDVDNPPNTCCPIRMDMFTEETEISQINKCKHIFCREEIRKWLETHHTCPLCRTPIDELTNNSTN